MSRKTGVNGQTDNEQRDDRKT